MYRTLLLCLTFFFVVASGLQAAADDAPYIYYHAEALNAIVIERADGTDSRMIAAGVMPDNHTIVSGPGWSPSGRWFAWTSTYAEIYRRGPSKIWIISADGTQRLTLLDDVSHAAYASWSPTGDYLLVIDANSEGDYVGTGTPDNPGHELYLVDVNERRLAAFFDDIYVFWGAFPRFWSADGTDAFYEYMPMTSVSDEVREDAFTTRLLNVDGTYEDGLSADDIAPRQELGSDVEYSQDSVSPDGRFIASRERAVTDTLSGMAVQMRAFSGTTGGTCIYRWHPDSRWFLREDDMVFAGGGCSAGGVNVANVQGTVQRELGTCSLYFDNCAAWLPDNVIPHLGPGQPSSVMPEPLMTLPREGDVFGVGWHPDGSRLAVYYRARPDRDNAHMLEIWRIDVAQRTARLLQTVTVDACTQSLVFDCNVIWNPTGTRVALTSVDSSQIIDPEGGEVILTTDDYFGGWINDEDYILTESASAYDPFGNRIARTETGDRLVIVDAATDRVISTIDGTWFWSLMFMSEPDYLIGAGADGYDAIIVDLKTATLYPLPEFALETVSGVTVINDYIVGHGRGTYIYFWDADTRNVALRLNRHAPGLDYDGQRYLATGSSSVVEIWDLETLLP